jgi:hypothetical protein
MNGVMRPLGPLALCAVVLMLVGAAVYDLTRPPQPVSEARYDWGGLRPPRLPRAVPLPPLAPAPRVRSAIVVPIEAQPRSLSEPPPLGDAVQPPGPLPGRSPDPARLAEARRLLGEPRQPRRLGPYELWTDVTDEESLAFLDAAAAHLDEQYRARYGLVPIGAAAEAVVLFADVAAYLRFAGAEDRLADLRPSGHASLGLVALAVGERGATETAATLVHELTHLLNRRALGPALPPWLDEGLAEDLGKSEFDAQGRIAPGTFGGATNIAGEAVTHSGGKAALLLVSRALVHGSQPDLARLTALGWRSFVEADAVELSYARSLLSVRYLLDGGDPERAAVFRGFLAAIAAGGSAEAEALRTRLGWTWSEWDARLAAWIARRAEIPADAGVLSTR